MSRHTKAVRCSQVMASVVVAVTAAIALLPPIAEAQERGKRAGNTPERRGGYAENADALIPIIAPSLRAGDIVLVKGSNSSRMSRVVGALKALTGDA